MIQWPLQDGGGLRGEPLRSPEPQASEASGLAEVGIRRLLPGAPRDGEWGGPARKSVIVIRL